MKQLMKINSLILAGAFSLISFQSFSQSKQEEKITESSQVVESFGKMKENIPGQLMQKAEGIVIIPGLINAGLGIGGKRGKGLAMVKKADGTWSNPVFVTLTGGSIGFQAGVQSVDLVMVFMHSRTLDKIGKGDFTLGGEVSVAAGPEGRSTSANTDIKLEAEVYSYSRSRGFFAGISLNGAQLDVDKDANEAYYKSFTSSADVFAKSDRQDANLKALRTALKSLY